MKYEQQQSAQNQSPELGLFFYLPNIELERRIRLIQHKLKMCQFNIIKEIFFVQIKNV